MALSCKKRGIAGAVVVAYVMGKKQGTKEGLQGGTSGIRR